MNIINPNEIGSKISTLILESREKFIAVSPYLDLSEWKKILINLQDAANRGIDIEIYFREIREKDYQVLRNLNIKLFEVKGLHTKLYLNESSIIVSSMNLYEFSDLHSIDIALQFDNVKDYNKLFHYFSKYIVSKRPLDKFISKASEKRLIETHRFLSERFSEYRITSTKTYLFSKNLLPIFHTFIDLDFIGLKYPVKNPTDQDVDEITDLLDKNLDVEVIRSFYNTSEETIYYKWEIKIDEFNDIEIANVLSDLSDLKLRPTTYNAH
ncbi:hypothetical protein MG296_14300 [Flavobacteriaceae bacterium TK19130]|nr:hypothetical protein [Thermobacterium salinum]